VYVAAGLFVAWVFDHETSTLADRPLLLGLLAFLAGTGTSLVSTAWAEGPVIPPDPWRDSVRSAGFIAVALLQQVELAHLVRDLATLAAAATITAVLIGTLIRMVDRLGRRNHDDDAAA
jgi:hypothetical protein